MTPLFFTFHYNPNPILKSNLSTDFNPSIRINPNSLFTNAGHLYRPPQSYSALLNAVKKQNAIQTGLRQRDMYAPTRFVRCGPFSDVASVVVISLLLILGL